MICVRSLPSMQPSYATSTAVAANKFQSSPFVSAAAPSAAALLPVRHTALPLQASETQFGAPPKLTQTVLFPALTAGKELTVGALSFVKNFFLHPISWVGGSVAVLFKSIKATDASSITSGAVASATALTSVPVAAAVAPVVTAATVAAAAPASMAVAPVALSVMG
jgi:hypothetical protein